MDRLYVILIGVTPLFVTSFPSSLPPSLLPPFSAHTFFNKAPHVLFLPPSLLSPFTYSVATHPSLPLSLLLRPRTLHSTHLFLPSVSLIPRPRTLRLTQTPSPSVYLRFLPLGVHLLLQPHPSVRSGRRGHATTPLRVIGNTETCETGSSGVNIICVYRGISLVG